MPLLLLLLLTVACLPENWPLILDWGSFRINLLFASGLTWLGIALIIFAAAWLAHKVQLSIRAHPQARETLLQQYARRRYYHLLGLIGFYTLALYVLGWGWSIQSLGALVDASEGKSHVLLPGTELLLLAPFLTGLLLSWACFYDADRALNRGLIAAESSFWSRRTYVLFHLRHNLGLVFVPLILIMAQRGMRWLFSDGDSKWINVFSLALPGAAFVGLPLLMRLVLVLKPMPSCELKDRLLAASRRLDFRCQIFLWDTHSRLANAMVVGVLPSLRYVLLSDRLVSELSGEEIEAVFGHEIGHVRHRHILFYCGFFVASVLALQLLWALATTQIEMLRDWFPTNEDWKTLPLVGLIGAYIFVVFGFLSRRCERQADVFGCRAVSCGRPDCESHDGGSALPPGGRALCSTGIRTFVDALEKVAHLNDVSRSRPGWLQSWQHSTIANRVEFLERVMADRSLETRFQRRVGLVKWGLVLSLATVILILVGIGGWNALFL